MLWFADQMDSIQDDSATSFAPAGSWAPIIIAIYGAQVSDHWLLFDANGELIPGHAAQLRSGERPIAAVLGPPQQTQATLDAILRAVPELDVELDVTDDRALGFRLVVLRLGPEPT